MAVILFETNAIKSNRINPGRERKGGSFKSKIINPGRQRKGG